MLEQARQVLFLEADTHQNELRVDDEEFQYLNSLLEQKTVTSTINTPMKVMTVSNAAAGGGGILWLFGTIAPEEEHGRFRFEHSTVESWITRRINELRGKTKTRLRYRGFAVLGTGFFLQFLALLVGVSWIAGLFSGLC